MYIIKSVDGRVLTSQGFLELAKGTESEFALKLSEGQALGVVRAIGEAAGKRYCYADKV